MSLLGKAFDLLQKYGDVVGVDWFKGPSLLDKLPNLGVLELAGSPILASAQVAIKGMKQTTGSGEPEDGADFKKSSAKYTEAGDLVFEAAPLEDRWNGTAAGAYKEKNEAHRSHTFGVASAEADMHRLIGQLAAQVTLTRENLDGHVQFLSDVDTATAWMNAVPGGAMVKATTDLATATAVLAQATGDVAILTAESVSKAGEIRKTVDTYHKAAAQIMIGEPVKIDANADGRDDGVVPCDEPFGSERISGTLPDRADPDTRYEVPDPKGPAVEYPPATPYTESPR